MLVTDGKRERERVKQKQREPVGTEPAVETERETKNAANERRR